jgi:hypothetical protein
MGFTHEVVRTTVIVAALEGAGFSFYESSKKSDCYKRGVTRVYVKKTGNHPLSAARSILHQAGFAFDEIKRVLEGC